jgi:hypothetical protein
MQNRSTLQWTAGVSEYIIDLSTSNPNALPEQCFKIAMWVYDGANLNLIACDMKNGYVSESANAQPTERKLELNVFEQQRGTR